MKNFSLLQVGLVLGLWSWSIGAERLPAADTVTASGDSKIRVVDFFSWFKKNKDVNYLDAKGINLLNQGQFVQAVDVLNQSLIQDPKNLRARSNRGIAYVALGKNNAAIIDLEETMRLDAAYRNSLSRPLAQAYLQRAREKVSQGNRKAAKDDLEKAVKIDPGNAMAHAELGRLYYLLKKYDSCLDSTSRALFMNAQLYDGFITRTACRSMMSQYSEALNDLTVAIHLNPDKADAYAARANVYHGLRRYDEALSDAEKAISLDPNLIPSLKSLIDNCRNSIKK